MFMWRCSFVIVFAWQIIRVRRIKQHYARFDELFPGLQRRYETFIDDAEYLDEKLWCTGQRRNF